jgi:hypothetical protein
MFAETLIAHGSDWIEWLDASGLQAGGGQPLAPQRLVLRLSSAPPDLGLVHKARATTLWRSRLAGMTAVVPGLGTQVDRAAPIRVAYDLAGVVVDADAGYLPRAFALRPGAGTGVQVRLYRSSLGTRFGQGGGVQGRLLKEDGSGLPWALLSLSVQPLAGGVMEYVAQADAQGEFRLALDRLPLLPKDAHVGSYAAVLKVRASLACIPEQPADPDKFTAIQVCIGKTTRKKPKFGTSLGLGIVPGTVTTVISPGQSALVLKSS